MICKICGNTKDNKVFKAKEMMFGTGDCFDYIECSNCGCLQISQVPDNLGDYYPKNYSSHNLSKPNFIKGYIIRKRDSYAFFKKSILGKYIYQKRPNEFLSALGDVHMDFNSKILDVGSGTGYLVNKVENQGYKNLWGVDPFIESNIIRENVKILKKPIKELDEDNFDYIIFNHSLEHIEDHLENIRKASQILSNDGTIVIAMPVKSDYIWNLYHENWVQLDAPRHVLIHSLKSFDTLGW